MKVSTGHDHEIPKDVDLDSSRQRIFCITERGLFSSWSFQTMELLYQRAFNMQSTAMIVLKSHLYIIITFEKRVIVLDVKNHKEAKEIPSFAMDLSLVSSDTRVSYDEKMLAVAMAPNDTINTKISIFSINYDECTFEEYHTVEGISSSILFMDFSSDNVYLLYMDNIGKKHNIDLKDKRKDTRIELKDIEWISEGLKISDKRSGIDTFYTEENNVTCLVRAGRRSLIVADQIGSVRIFEYPCSSTGYYRMYNHHLNFIRTMHVSKNGEYLISTSTIDKCIFVWKILNDRSVAGDQDNERSEDYSKFD